MVCADPESVNNYRRAELSPEAKIWGIELVVQCFAWCFG